MRNQKKILSGLICSLLSLGLTTSGLAAEEVFNMEEYVVTANRVP